MFKSFKRIKPVSRVIAHLGVSQAAKHRQIKRLNPGVCVSLSSVQTTSRQCASLSLLPMLASVGILQNSDADQHKGRDRHDDQVKQQTSLAQAKKIGI